MIPWDKWEHATPRYEDGIAETGTVEDYDATDWQAAVDEATLADLFDTYDEEEDECEF